MLEKHTYFRTIFRPFFLIGTVAACAADEAVTFNAHIRPLLSDRCFACHGFDSNTREADLRLDTPEGAFAKREEGPPAIVPGDADASAIWQRITATDPDDVMPPPDYLRQLGKGEKDLIRRWIEQGAEYEPHWTFVPVKKPATDPQGGHPLDQLVAKRLEREGLALSEEADRRTLVRRLSFDLRGLPPQPDEVSAFLKDDSPDAWEKLVDRFLADPAFGERMAWPWLDAARYADTNGYQNDAERTMWPWRDWVIDAFNRNLPYDDFTVWQIAGDLLPDPTFEQKLATGFLRNHAINGEGGRIPEENRVDYVMDMSETVGTVWMALTLNCCRCHDHKYDALSQKEYYGFYDFFNQTPVTGKGGDPQTPPAIPAPSQEQGKREAELADAIHKLENQLTERAAVLASGQAAWEAKQAAPAAPDQWRTLHVDHAASSEVTLKALGDNTVLHEKGDNKNANYEVRLGKLPETIAALRLETLGHPSFKGLSYSESGNFVLTAFEADLVMPDGKRTPLKFTGAEATYEQKGYPVQAALDANPETGWAVYRGKLIDEEHAAVFQLAEPVTIPKGATLEVRLRHESKHERHLIGRFRVSASTSPPVAVQATDPALQEALAVEPGKRSKEQNALLRKTLLAEDESYRGMEKQLAAQRSELDKLRKTIPKVMVMADQRKRRDAFVLAVGSYEQPGEKVVAHTPAVLPPLKFSGEHANRLDLARWLVSPEHPLTARVTVNRLWQDFFGIGFIKTPEDFGVQSEIPIHQPALDWLSAGFMESGWDFKELVRTIVTSRTYRQSSQVTPQMLEKDPDNRLLARGPRFRLPAWMIRDQALAVSGLLIPEIGGEPVFPWQPPGLWEEVTFGKGKKTYKPDTGEKLRRRSIYTFWRRISAPPMFFDSAKREMCDVGVTRTNSPLHALATLNDPLYAESARVLAARSWREGDKPVTTLASAFEIALGRSPSDKELGILGESHDAALAEFQADPASATAFLSVGESPRIGKLEPIAEAALATVCLSILNTDEILNKE